jgi:hypothetical protein
MPTTNTPATVATIQRLAGLLDMAMNYAARDMREQAQAAADIALEAIAEALEARTTPAQLALGLADAAMTAQQVQP